MIEKRVEDKAKDFIDREHKKKDWETGYAKFGFATLAYLNFHLQLILLLLVIFLLQVPGIYIWNAFEFGANDSHTLLQKLQFAKLGFSKPICKNTLMMNSFIDFNCNSGEISHIESFGIIPEDSID